MKQMGFSQSTYANTQTNLYGIPNRSNSASANSVEFHTIKIYIYMKDVMERSISSGWGYGTECQNLAYIRIMK